MADPVTCIQTPVSLDFTHTADAATALYLDGLASQRLVGGRCAGCGRVFAPIRTVCPTCCVGPMAPVDLPQTGEVVAFCVINIPFPGQVLTPPYACAHVMLDGADVPLFHLIADCPADRVHAGLRVQAVWHADPATVGHAWLRWFRPIEAA